MLDQPMENTGIVKRGVRHDIRFAQRADGSYPSKDGLDRLLDKSPDDANQLFALLLRTAEHGAEFHNDRKFRQLESADGIFEFKSNKDHYRLFAFADGREWVLTHVGKKPKDYSPEIRLARKIRDEHLERKAQGRMGAE